MVSPEHPFRRKIGEAFSHLVTESSRDALGLKGMQDVAKREWTNYRTKGFGNGVSSTGKAAEGAIVGGVAQWVMPATYKALFHSDTFLESMRFLPGLALDTVNLSLSVAFWAANGFNPLALVGFKSLINLVESGFVDGVGHAADHTFGRFRREKR